MLIFPVAKIVCKYISIVYNISKATMVNVETNVMISLISRYREGLYQ